MKKFQAKNFTPMLATLIDKPFDDKNWIFEIKWDGYRALAFKDEEIRLMSRGKKSFNAIFPKITSELKKLKAKQCILDGEIVILDKNGKSQFQLLQNYQKRKIGIPYYYVFDILAYNNKDLTNLPLLERKKILKKILVSAPHIKFSDHIVEKGIAFFKLAMKKKLEGIMAKKSDSTYQLRRSKDWLKIKTRLRQEVVIGGFSKPKGGRKYFGALLIGVYEKDKLKYTANVGSGFDQTLLKEIYGQLKKITTSKCPFSPPPFPADDITWVEPKLVCEVAFAEWTDAGKMRQPIFKGMRIDKKAKEVSREKFLKNFKPKLQ
jgi:bifunctional non-homologous end joining protein LigD